MTIKSPKKKGSDFEREVAKLFKEVLGIELTRTPSSGGWGRYHTKGDLTDPKGGFRWFVECKKHESWDLWGALFAGQVTVTDWWKKTKQQAKSENKLPVLVLTQNFKTPLALFRVKDLPFAVKPFYSATDADGEDVVLIGLHYFLYVLKEKGCYK